MFRWITKLFRRPSKESKTTPVSDSDDDVIYALPYEAGARFRVLQGYGGSYSHTDESHFSIDFQMPEGTPICASRSGVVYHVIDHFTDGGIHRSFLPKANAVYILHPDDSIAAYVHLMAGGSSVVAGEAVSTGQIIGYSGNTGWSSTPHLHFHVSDAILHKRSPTLFDTVERGITMINVDHWYTKPSSQCRLPERKSRSRVVRETNIERDAFAFSPELLQIANDVAGDLAEAGYEAMSDYSSIDAMHDVHGLEVCGIQGASDALEITRILLRHFPGWNAGWIHAPTSSSSGDWVAHIQRDHDDVMEFWDTD
ncbi:MAG: mepM [Schlesneria sp.]|nr:mepM [Schlesneria sp.]